jgi:hypothetical protein
VNLKMAMAWSSAVSEGHMECPMPDERRLTLVFHSE